LLLHRGRGSFCANHPLAAFSHARLFYVVSDHRLLGFYGIEDLSSDADLMVLVNVELSGTSKAVSCCLISSLIFDRPPALFLSKGVTL